MSARTDSAMAAVAADEVAEVRLLRPQPGDVLIVRLKERLTNEEFTEFSERLRAHFEDTGIKGIVLDPDADVDVVRKDGE